MSGTVERKLERAPAAGSGWKVEAQSSNQFTVHLWGDLGLGWFGRLATALAQRGLNIDSAQAVRDGDSAWSGTLQLSTSGSPAEPVDPRSLDYVTLSNESCAVGHEVNLSCDTHRLVRTETGTLQLRLIAADQLGLLSSLLDRLQFLGLFPERLRVTTTGQFVDDTLWLRGVAGHPPSTQAEQALRELLTRITRPAN
jgi:UTP:GlnB (protein PII) uridylyltransferase